jgi:iron complex outermembrane receptor protein
MQTMPSALAQHLFAAAAAAACAATPVARAQDGAGQTVVVTGSIAERRVEDAPYAISVIDAQSLRTSGPMVNLSEAMARVPGIVAANRNNYAQDLQISSRGFGARAGFGVRGIRLYTDGIPASMPDGQGQVSHFALAGAERIEVLRGPFSVLYGNSSGGVIALFTAPAREGSVEFATDQGSFGLSQLRVSVASPLGSQLDLRASASHLEWDGFRPHAGAHKDTGAVRLGWQPGEADRVVIHANSLDQPADDPLGLTRAQFDADPRQTTSQATQFDTRKTTSQVQLGVNWQHRFSGMGALARSELTLWQGARSVAQWLAINAATQASPRHGGGVIAFDRGYAGADARLAWHWSSVDLVTGVASERQRDDRRGYLDYTGIAAAPVYGVTGALRRDEIDRASSNDAYAQVEWQASDAIAVIGGVRGGRVKLSADDHYLSNGNDSGERRFSYTDPVIGLRCKASSTLTLHASAARGFESPTLGDLAYRRDGSGGFNLDLQPQKSRQVEVGAKWRAGALSLDAALFRIDVDDEIGVATNAGGRQSFTNVGRTLRQGGELALGWRLAPSLRAQAAVTLLDATYRDGFLTCTGIPCTTPTVPVAAGNRIAGTQRGTAFAELVATPWRGGELGVEVRSASALTANDTNTEAAPRYTLLALRANQRFVLPEGFTLDMLARMDNAADKAHVGSVIVNEANGRFYEPGTPRAWLLSLRLGRSF